MMLLVLINGGHSMHDDIETKHNERPFYTHVFLRLHAVRNKKHSLTE